MALSEKLIDWAGSAIMGNLINTAYSCLAQHLLPEDTRDELERMEIALPRIATVMSVAEFLKMEHPNSGFHAWILQFRMALEAAEDVLDDLKYKELEEMVQNRDAFPMVRSLKRKWKDFCGRSIDGNVLKRLRSAVKQLDQAASSVGAFFQLVRTLGIKGLNGDQNHNQTGLSNHSSKSSFSTESMVFCREDEKEAIIDWLKQPVSHQDLSGYCIVGLGGLGKSTLAQFIYQEMKGEHHFEEIIWVHVSNNFAAEDIIRKILKALGEKSCEDQSLSMVQLPLEQKLIPKKFLLILDDVWNDDNEVEWRTLIQSFKPVQRGSKILLTTRKISVPSMLARVLNNIVEFKTLKGMEEQKLLLLLKSCAFKGSHNPENHVTLQFLQEVVKLLNGSPLAAKLIGSLLNCSVHHYWERILNQEYLLCIDHTNHGINHILRLCYNHLPVYLQACFRYCSIFPKDYVFHKDELIKMWIGSGLIQQPSCKKKQEDIGEDYFNCLVRRSFFHHKEGEEYIMHDLLNEFSQTVSEGECCRVERSSDYDTLPGTVRHISILGCEVKNLIHLNRLLTLVISTVHQKHISDPVFTLKKINAQSLRLLSISVPYSCKLPENIGCCLRLRFLSIKLTFPCQYVGPSRSRIPKSIYNLYHLQVLDLPESFLSDYSGIEAASLANLVSLRHLKLPEHIMKTIHGVHILKSLQELTFFVGQESGYCIDELGTLNNLQHLSIKNIENITDTSKVEKDDISRKQGLVSLSLSWSSGSNPGMSAQIINYLQPNPELEKLAVENYTGGITPNWMSNPPQSNLTSLRLVSCTSWEDLPLQGQMPLLKVLHLEQLEKVQKINCCDLPSLEILYCSQLSNLKSWDVIPNYCCFPRLNEIEIKDCPKLTELPNLPFSLIKFKVCNVGLASLPGLYNSDSITNTEHLSRESSLRVVEISNCPRFETLNGFLQQDNVDFKVMVKLLIQGCKNLKQVLVGASCRIILLKQLCIHKCNELIEQSSMEQNSRSDIENNFTSVKVNHLCIDHLSLLLKEPLRSLRSVRELSIHDCSRMETMPEEWLLQNGGTLRSIRIKDASSLKSLPASLCRLTSLEILTIENGTSLHELPIMPMSMKHKII